MGNMNLFFGLITAGCGIYCLYLWIKIRVTNRIPDGCMILPKGLSIDDCIDRTEYLAHILPRLMIFGVLITVFGAITLAEVYFPFFDALTADLTVGMRLLLLETVTCFIPLAVVIWFCVSMRRAQKRLF